MLISSPLRATARRSSVLTGEAAWHSEERKVVMADENLRGFVHGGVVESMHDLPGAIAVERKGSAPVGDAIEIMARGGREARVEIVGRPLAGEHADRVGSYLGVEGIVHFLRRPVLAEIDMRDLAKRMHAGIGSPGPARDRLFTGEGLDGLGETPLHRRTVLLHLPADEGRAVIFENELVAGHGG